MFGDPVNQGVPAPPLTRDRVIEMLNNFADGQYQTISPDVCRVAASLLADSMPVAVYDCPGVVIRGKIMPFSHLFQPFNKGEAPRCVRCGLAESDYRTAPAKEASAVTDEEAVARAIWMEVVQEEEPDERPDGWEDEHPSHQATMRKAARAAISVIQSRRSSPVREEMKNRERILPTESDTVQNKEELPDAPRHPALEARLVLIEKMAERMFLASSGNGGANAEEGDHWADLDEKQEYWMDLAIEALEVVEDSQMAQSNDHARSVGSPEARELVGRLRLFHQLLHRPMAERSEREAAQRAISEAAETIERLLASPSEPSGRGERNSIIEECARIAEDKLYEDMECNSMLRRVADEIRSLKSPPTVG